MVVLNGRYILVFVVIIIIGINILERVLPFEFEVKEENCVLFYILYYFILCWFFRVVIILIN